MPRWVFVVIGLIGVALIAWGITTSKPPQQAAPAPGGVFALADLHRLADVAEPVFAPDGESLVYSLTTDNLETDAQVSDLWRVDWASGEARQLTRTPKASEWAPAFSADGRWLVFLGDGDGDDDTQLWRMPARGGRPKQVSRLPGGISDFSLSPDGQKAVVVAETGGPQANAAGTTPPIVIDRFWFKEDGRGHLDTRRQQLFIVDLRTGKAKALTSGDFDHWLPSWSADGRSIAFVSKRGGPDPDRNLNFDVFVVPASGGAPRRMGDFAGADGDPTWESRPAWSPDSRRLVWLRSDEDRWIYYTTGQMVVADVATGHAKPVAWIDRTFYSPRWSADGKQLLALVEQDRDTWLARIDPASGQMAYLTHGAHFAYDFAVGPRGRLAVLDGGSDAPYELRTVGAASRPLTRHNAWLGQRKLAATRDVSFANGGAEIHGILTLPPGYVAGRRYPVIVRLHGGPVYQYSHEFMADWQLYAAAGYVVLGINPRGSSGRGAAFSRAIYADWGNVDVADVKAGVDWLIAAGIADPERLGVGGWSYGGILTNYVVASDPRFKAAVSGAGMANFLGGYGADMYVREYEAELGQPWRNTALWTRLSYPFLQADRISAAVLFQCAANDVNVPCIGAEQMYQALKSRGLDTRLVVYPDETHGLSVPSYRADRLKRNLDWYDRHLK
ncbi:MAG: S9 family peptidase [Caulobacter sp.]|nr:S9 family peptidase [Caulobacter sp.]